MKLLERLTSGGEAQFVAPDPPQDPGKSRRRLTFWVRTTVSTANVQGECDGVQIVRSGALIVFGDRGKRRHFAPGYWLECNTEDAHNG